ncbi:hypothetical protein KC19_1G134200 [Ceratodon purpureus]|uniref:Uncharacterized protein n=1 Tax=Ceratodon purpureus TaxID=3225 RepID=A0A8T0J4S1_CERPU|nr:hypothetical protein KC19_1G134200 [Ceratodon purpureus]
MPSPPCKFHPASRSARLRIQRRIRKRHPSTTPRTHSASPLHLLCTTKLLTHSLTHSHLSHHLLPNAELDFPASTSYPRHHQNTLTNLPYPPSSPLLPLNASFSIASFLAAASPTSPPKLYTHASPTGLSQLGTS